MKHSSRLFIFVIGIIGLDLFYKNIPSIEIWGSIIALTLITILFQLEDIGEKL